MTPSPNTNGAHQPEPVQTGAHPFEQEWLNVEQAVVYCAELGLTRTPKTIRKWAERSSGLPEGDVLARKEDTPWGYKWQIEKVSLTRKVDEELELRAANSSEPVRTGLPEQHRAEPEKVLETQNEPGGNSSEPVRTRSHHLKTNRPTKMSPKQVRTGSHRFSPVRTWN